MAHVSTRIERGVMISCGMSGIASFVELPESDLVGLRDAATPRKRFLGKPKDTYHDYLAEHGRAVTHYSWSGFILATLLPYLQEKHGIDLMHSNHDELATFLTEARGATHFILTNAHRTAFEARLDPKLFSEADLRDYFNEFNGVNEPQMGKAMLDGVAAFHLCLGHLHDHSVVVTIIG
jgi:hypothetical protein